MDNTEALFDLTMKCCACAKCMPFGGHWGWHREGYRVGPFCDDCADKADVVHEVDSPLGAAEES